MEVNDENQKPLGTHAISYNEFMIRAALMFYPQALAQRLAEDAYKLGRITDWPEEIAEPK